MAQTYDTIDIIYCKCGRDCGVSTTWPYVFLVHNIIFIFYNAVVYLIHAYVCMYERERYTRVICVLNCIPI